VTADGRKSPHGSGRFILKGMRKWAEYGLFRLGAPGPRTVECEGAEKGLTARAAGAEYVVVTGGISRIGKPLFISSGSAAFITRSIELHHPTVLCDEFDAVTKGDPEKGETIRALINSVFNREGSTQGKCIVTDAGPVPRLFSTWSPIWLAGIKAVPRTIEDRAVHIALRRKLPSDRVKRLRLKDGPEFTVFRRKAARFAADNEQQLRDIEPPSPVELEEVGDRAADTWDSLLAIADVAGGDWPRRARAAALVLAGVRDEDDNATAVSMDGDDELELLADIRAILFAIDAYAPDAQPLEPDATLVLDRLRERCSAAGSPD